MSYRFKIFFYARKNYVDINGEISVMIRLMLDGQKAQFTSHLKVDPALWDSKLNMVKGNSKAAVLVNEKLREIRMELNLHYKELKQQGIYFTVDKIKDAFLGVKSKVQMLLVVFREHNEELKLRIGKDITAAGVKKYERTCTRLGEFLKHRYNIDDIPLKEIDYNFIYSFETYLTTVWNSSVNTVAKYLQRLKHIVVLAKHNGWIPSNPFVNFKIKFKKVDRGYLTEDELVTIMEKKFAIKRLEQVRDIFVFSCFTGLAYIDVRNLNAKDIQKSFDGRLWIIKKRQKTDVQSNILLLDIPKRILDKYRGMPNENRLLPIISNQRLNSYLKEIADLCGIEKNLTFHVARHTFATTVTLAKGVPMETVSKMLGHTSIKTTQIYARITNDKISHDMQELSKKLQNMAPAFSL
ncbi:site-specific integrase [Maribellus maritimus]|uniref:site-specific integrase n=1 Tax=Maribellus maritimus TaxID=2870838 RepID=UPI001EEC4C50|nr:site-specific integrase [Maribellus maritimus]MCG6190205.1 site-specific integrase [Maribellus maritimus]